MALVLLDTNKKFIVTGAVSSYLGLRVSFSQGVQINSALLNPNNYSIVVTIPSLNVDYECISVTPEPNVTYPTYVDLEVTDCTHGAEYQVVVDDTNIRSLSDEVLLSNTATFTGFSELPNVLLAESLSLTLIRVTFSKTMAHNADIELPTTYQFTNGLRVTAVEFESVSTVLLTTSEQVPGELYELTVG